MYTVGYRMESGLYSVFCILVCSIRQTSPAVQRQYQMDQRSQGQPAGKLHYYSSLTAKIYHNHRHQHHHHLKLLLPLLTVIVYVVFLGPNLFHCQVVGSQARILYSDQRGRIDIAVAFNKAIANKKIKVTLTCVLYSIPFHRTDYCMGRHFILHHSIRMTTKSNRNSERHLLTYFSSLPGACGTKPRPP